MAFNANARKLKNWTLTFSFLYHCGFQILDLSERENNVEKEIKMIGVQSQETPYPTSSEKDGRLQLNQVCKKKKKKKKNGLTLLHT